MSVLIICPTRDRPGDFRHMVESFLETSTHARLVAFVDSDQQALYQGLDADDRVSFEVEHRRGPIASVNLVAEKHRADIYGTVPDDCLFLVKGWDDYLEETFAEMPGRLGVVSASHNQGGFVNFPFVSREWIDLAGFYAYPKQFHFCWDTVIELLGDATRLVHAPSERIAFKHIGRPQDFTTYLKDSEALLNWCMTDRRGLIERMRIAMGWRLQ